MPKITYIKDGDGENCSRVVVDGLAFDSTTFANVVDADIHAIQWDGSQGEIEFTDDRPNELFTDISRISAFELEEKWQTEKTRLDEWEAGAEEREIKQAIENDPNNAVELDESRATYVEKRRMAYDTPGNQVDMIYRAGLGGEEFQAHIRSVKERYPKPTEE